MTTMSQPNMDARLLVTQIKNTKNQIERMKLLLQLQDVTGVESIKELIEKFGFAPTSIYRTIRLQNLPPLLLALMEVGDATGRKLPLSTACIIARQPVSEHLGLAERVMTEGVSAQRLKKILSEEGNGADEATPSAPEESTETAKSIEPPLKQMLMALVRAEQSLAVLREFTWAEFRGAFESKEEIENLRRHLAYIGLRTGEFDEMLNVVLRTKF